MLFDGPYGRFWPRPETERLLCLAGGIGITPFLSIAGEWEHSGVPCPATLIWSVRTREELIDEGLFERVASRHELFTCVPVITGLPGAGRIDSRLLSAHLDSSALCGTAVYICGPDAMRRALSGMLRTLGIPRSAIHYEDFSA